MCKDQGFEKGLTGLKEFAAIQRRAQITTDYQHECCMIDYADFNAQHSPEAQAIIFEEAALIGEVRGFHPDWIKAHKWIAAAKYNMTMSVPGSDLIYKVLMGMFSGTKSTDLINTVANA